MSNLFNGSTIWWNPVMDQHSNWNDHEISRLVKVLELSSSNIDEEALAAVRMSQRILKKHHSSYEMLFASVRGDARLESEKRIYDLLDIVRKQSSEINQLKSAPRKAPQAQFAKVQMVSGPIERLKSYLLGNSPLRDHERKILENISDVAPKSKEEYLIMVCARRHNVNYQPSA